MRVALIVPGGAGRFPEIPVLTEFARNLSRHHDVSVFSLSATDDPYQRPGYRLWSADSPRPNKRSLASVAIQLLRSHARAPFDVFHGFWGYPAGSLAVYAARLSRRRSVVTLQGGEVAALSDIAYGDQLSQRRSNTLASVCRMATAVVALTEFQASAFERAGLGSLSPQIIPWGVDPHRFEYHPCPLVEPLRFVHVGNITEVKNQTSLVRVFRAVKRTRNATLTIVGPDHMEGALQAYVAAQGLSDAVEFTGFVPNSDLPRYLKNAHALLHTSRWESQCIAAVEAAMSGVLVCGTPTGILADWSDTFVIHDDEESLARAIVEVTGSSDAYRQLTERARDRAVKYSSEWTVSQYLKLYESIRRL